MRKRKIKVYVKKTIFVLCIFLGVFLASTAVLFKLFAQNPKVISPLSLAFSKIRREILGEDTNKIIAQTEDNLSKHHLLYSSVTEKDTMLIIAFTDGTEAILTPKKNIEEQIDSLQVTMSRLTIQGKHISRVDVRFERPVVSY